MAGAREQTGGFTLLELLVAISISSILGLGAYQMLQTVIQSHDRVRAGADDYAGLSLALSIIQRDFSQFLPRPVRDEYGELLPPLEFDNETYLVEFTRGGWSNPGGRQRSRLQRVAYSLDYDSGKLSRHFWEVLDRAEDTQAISQVLLAQVTDFRVTGVDASDLEKGFGTGFDEFDLESEPDPENGHPLAVEVVIETETLNIRRLFQLAAPFRQGANQWQPGDAGAPEDDDDSPDGDDDSPEGDDDSQGGETEVKEP